MKTTKFLINIGLVLLLSVVMLLPSCKKDDAEEIPEDTTASFTLLSNGNSVNTSMGSTVLSHLVYDDHVWSQIDLVANSGANRFTLTMYNFDAQNPPIGGIKVKKYYPNINFGSHLNVADGYISDYGGATWLFNSKMYVCPSDAQKTDFVEITSCDNQGKKLSGHFRFTVKDSGNPNDSLILSGFFDNQNYVVLNK